MRIETDRLIAAKIIAGRGGICTKVQGAGAESRNFAVLGAAPGPCSHPRLY